MLTEKQILTLFLLSTNTGIKGIHTLVKIFDNADFPADMAENLNVLLSKNMIIISERFDNGTEKEFEITTEGKLSLSTHFDSSKIIGYIKKMDNPVLLLEIVQNVLKQTSTDNS